MNTPIEQARDLCHQADIEVLKCRKALALAESVRADRHLEFEALLEQQRFHLTTAATSSMVAAPFHSYEQ